MSLAAAIILGVSALSLLGFYDTSSAQAQSTSEVLVGAGDIASCDSKGDTATAKLLGSIPGTVFTAGDNAYQEGTLYQFNHCYDPTWGLYEARTKPAVGNHEYRTPGASGYFDYFGARAGRPGKGYYSYNRGAWHVIAQLGVRELGWRLPIDIAYANVA